MMHTETSTLLPGRGGRVCIMQPYLFPYIGYFQLAHAVDAFWISDTVSFIRKGWMNRNSLLINKSRKLFSVPVRHSRHDTAIYDCKFAPTAFFVLNKLLKTIAKAYSRAPELQATTALVRGVRDHLVSFGGDADFTTVVEKALQECFDRLSIRIPVRRVSSLDLAAELTGQARVIAACQAIGARCYVNMAGGISLYDHLSFAEAGIELRFLYPGFTPYRHAAPIEFIPALSILDIIACVDIESLQTILNNYRLE